MRVSLIAATINRYEPLDELIESVIEQEYSDFELIIVDQNVEGFLEPLVRKYEHDKRIKWIRSEKGLSKARNKGLEVAIGDVVAFPDDDCRYLKDTLVNGVNLIRSTPRAFGVMGRIVDENGNDSLKKWKRMPFRFTKLNMYKHSSSITIFMRNKSDLRFDERLGAGTYFGACEDIDLIYQVLKKKRRIFYCPQIRLYHPHEDAVSVKIEKITQYGLGFGAFTKKNFDLSTFILFCIILGFHFICLFKSLCILDGIGLRKRLKYITSRINGFIEYDHQF